MKNKNYIKNINLKDLETELNIRKEKKRKELSKIPILKRKLKEIEYWVLILIFFIGFLFGKSF